MPEQWLRCVDPLTIEKNRPPLEPGGLLHDDAQKILRILSGRDDGLLLDEIAENMAAKGEIPEDSREQPYASMYVAGPVETLLRAGDIEYSVVRTVVGKRIFYERKFRLPQNT